MVGRSERLGSSGHGRGSVPDEDVEIIEVSEKHGPLYNAIPRMPLPLAVVLCIFNIVIPGLGTFFTSWACLCGCKTKLGSPAKAFGLNLLSAILQMLSFVLIVGWVWSIIWGMNFLQISIAKRDQSDHEPVKPYYVRRQSSVVE
ncbi:protein stum homolog [Biomphalaria glabrata]|uniref:Protein stum homolog n=1 Tax=Biomphalaria glabrata TaxID=6526 RepID=A0A9W3A1N2_BIOGL|nr:protein stum homolog [Biomphalaria glabrata]